MFQFGTVQKRANLVEHEDCCKKNEESSAKYLACKIPCLQNICLIKSDRTCEIPEKYIAFHIPCLQKSCLQNTLSAKCLPSHI